MTKRLLCVLATGCLVTPAALSAQQIGGEYQVEVRGTTHYLDRTPATRQLQDNTVLVVKQHDDEITLEFGSFASAMSTTVFEGRVGNDRFVALWSSPSRPGEARLITGEVDGRRLRGRLIYPRTTAEAAVPGWTEVEFAAVPHERTGQAVPTPRTGRDVRPGRAAGLRPRGELDRRAGAAGADGAAVVAPFEVEVAAMTDPDEPLAGHRIGFLARATPVQRAESVERMELWVNGLVQGSSDGDVLEIEAGPFGAGRLDYDIVAISGDGRRSAPSTHRVMITPPGNSTISGRITGNPQMIVNVQLVRPSGSSVAISTLDANARYRISGVPAGQYVIFVNDAKTEARVSPTSNLEIDVDGRNSYTRDFEVR